MPPFGDIVLLVAYLPMLALYLLLFSEIGFGATIFKELTMLHEIAHIPAALGFLLIVFLYIVDFDVGNAVLNGLLYAVGGLAFMVSVVLSFRSMPYAPLLCYFFFMTLYYLGIYFEFFGKSDDQHERVSIKSYLSSTGKALIIGGCIGCLTFLVWAGVNNFWFGEDSKKEFRNRLRVCKNMTVSYEGGPPSACSRYGAFGTVCPPGPLCEQIVTDSACEPATGDEEPACLAAFMLWSAPLWVSAFSVIFGVALYLITASATQRKRVPGKEHMVLSHELYIFCQVMLGACRPYNTLRVPRGRKPAGGAIFTSTSCGR